MKIISQFLLLFSGMLAGKIVYNSLDIRNAALITLAAFLICILIFDTITESKRKAKKKGRKVKKYVRK